MSDGVLYVCGTPIGNLGDVTERLRDTLSSVDLVFAEDTRRTLKLLRHFGIEVPLRSLFVGNEAVRSGEVVAALAAGQDVALLTDAGMPSISDPGASTVDSVRKAGHRVRVVPGPSAVTSALALAGFGADRFVFEGFLPRKGAERQLRLESIASDERPTVLFLSPHRLTSDLKDLSEKLGGQRSIAICREITKLHEETWVGTLSEAVAMWDGAQVRGELTAVLYPAARREGSVEDAVERALTLISLGISRSEAARQAATEEGVSRRPVYDRLISAHRDN